MSAVKFVTVGTEYGPVKGAQIASVLGRDLFKFQTIPYMKAPVGKLRFRDAQAPEKWSEPLDATVNRPSYFTFNMMTTQIEGTEDAGVLSITTPYLDRKLPVAVYIHGGGFQYAYGSVDMYGGDFLLQKDIILVTINYRVGPIGFLSLNDPKLGIPGNAGLKDQVFALKWIKRNIASFGGDPNNITVFGTSAGAASVHFLMMSDQAKGLFQKALPMSGTSFVKSWASAPKKDLTERLAKSVGWSGEGGEQRMLEVLESASARDLVQNEVKLLTKEEIFAEHILFPFTPVVEPYITETTFLPKDPVILGRTAWGNDIECMIGGTSAEGGVMGVMQGNFFDYFNTPENFILARELNLDMTKATDKQKAHVIGEKLQRLYFGDDVPSAATHPQYIRYAGDLHFWHGIYRAAISRLNARGKGKTFLYRFDLQTSLNFFKIHFGLPVDGAAHGEDLFYLFKSSFPGLKGPAIDSKEFELMKTMVSIVTSFVVSGNPNQSSWEPLTAKSPLMCFNMTNDSFDTISLPEEEKLKVWGEIIGEEGVQLY